MTPELKAQLNARVAELIAAMTPAQQQHVAEHKRYQQVLWTVDTGWTGDGTLEYSVTEYVGPSELQEDNGATQPGAEGLAKFTDIDGSIWIFSRDFSTQPSRNRDWTQVVNAVF